MLDKIKRLINKPKPHIDANLEFVFQSGGVNYYKYKDDFSIPADRALSAADIYEELRQGISKDYLVSLLDSIELLLNKGKLVDASSLVKIAQSRLQHISNAKLIMKLATVIYIAEWENPMRYSLEDADKKIAHWLKHEKVNGFFLRQPISLYLPSIKSSEQNTQNYLHEQSKNAERELKSHLNLLSEMPESNDLVSSLQLQLEQTQRLTKWLQPE